MNAEQNEASFMLLMANHALRRAQNNERAFLLINQLAKTENSRLDAAGSALYWGLQVSIKKADVSEIESIINRHF